MLEKLENDFDKGKNDERDAGSGKPKRLTSIIQTALVKVHSDVPG